MRSHMTVSVSGVQASRNALLKYSIPAFALLDRENGAASVAIDDWDFEPTTLLEQLQIALYIAFFRRKADQEEIVGYLHRQARERRATRLFGTLSLERLARRECH